MGDDKETDNEDPNVRGTGIMVMSVLWILIIPFVLAIAFWVYLKAFVKWIGVITKPNSPYSTYRRLKDTK